MNQAPLVGNTLLIVLLLFVSRCGLAAQASQSEAAKTFSPAERLQTAHLRAAHEDALRLQQQRQALPPPRRLHDYRAILHAHAEDSAHTGGTRAEMLIDAHRASVQVIMLSDHFRPPRDFIRDSWRGLHEGVLFIPGSETRGFQVYPSDSITERMNTPEPEFIASVTASNGLIFLSHPEERLAHPMDGLTGMEIYNRHADAEKDKSGLVNLVSMLLDPAQLAELRTNVQLYPDELFAAQATYPRDYLNKWDTETIKGRLTGVAANDCHHNVILVVKMVDEATVRVGTNVDKDEEMRRVSADVAPGIRVLTRGHKPGDELARVDLDPYYRSFRNVATHILAPELTEAAIRYALQQGHAFVSHDWMCDGTGFYFGVSSSAGDGIMGDAQPFVSGSMLHARFPVGCNIRLLRDGKVIARMRGDRLEHSAPEPGVYRIEGWVTLDGEERPWLYSNPIYLR